MFKVFYPVRSFSTGVILKEAVAAESKQLAHLAPKNVKAIIGLEVHAQLNLQAKLFSQGSTKSQTGPNTNLDLLDASIPGSLPKLNGSALKAAIRTGLGLNCTIQDVIHFDRKNYFYTDMPAGFQITQYNKPIAFDGYVDFVVTAYHRSRIVHSQQYDIMKTLYDKKLTNEDNFQPYMKRSHIKQLQLEQDSAKTLHQTSNNDDIQGELNNLVDYNRSGAGLIEIVFAPDLTGPHEASSLILELIKILKALNTCDCELQEGSLRVDANVSIESIDGITAPKEVANRVELKNLNSLQSLYRGLSYEIQRQSLELAAGNQIKQESRTYDAKTSQTVILRAKESAIDYRYVPEPNIPPLNIDKDLIELIKRELREDIVQPSQVRELILSKYDIKLTLVTELIDEPGLARYFMSIMNEQSFDANVVADFLVYSVNNIKNICNLPFGVDLENCNSEFMKRLSPSKMQALFEMMFNEEVSFANAYETMKCLFTSDPQIQPRELIQQMNWFQINDDAQIEEHCKQVIKGMKSISKRYRKRGETRDMQYMLQKLNELNSNRISVKRAIRCLNRRLRPSDENMEPNDNE